MSIAETTETDHLDNDNLDASDILEHEIGAELDRIKSEAFRDLMEEDKRERANQMFDEFSDVYHEFSRSVENNDSELCRAESLQGLKDLQEYVRGQDKSDFDHLIKVAEGFCDYMSIDNRADYRFSSVEEILSPWREKEYDDAEVHLEYNEEEGKERFIEAGNGLRAGINSLIENAREHASEDLTNIYVELETYEGGYDEGVSIQVHDDGEGWDYEDPYQALSRGEGDGTGIGLAGIEDITNEYGGSIILGDSEKYGGARAELRVPTFIPKEISEPEPSGEIDYAELD